MPCPLWVKSRHLQRTSRCPLTQQKRGDVKRAFENALSTGKSLVTRPHYSSGATVVFEEPSGAACIPGGDWPCGLEAGAPPVSVLMGPVQPCGCFWPFVSGTGVWVRPVLYSGLLHLSPAPALKSQTGDTDWEDRDVCKTHSLPSHVIGTTWNGPIGSRASYQRLRQDNVRFGSKADMLQRKSMSALPPKRTCAVQSGCPLSAKSGHRFPYSITSSARSRVDAGMTRPSSFAVFKFKTNSNLVGVSIGVSAGLAPSNILAAITPSCRVTV